MKSARLIGAAGLLLLLVMSLHSAFVLRTAQLSYVESDGTGYYSYLPAVLLDHDLRMTRYVEDNKDRRFLIGFQANPQGGYLTKYPLGTALLQLPFVAVAAALSSDGQRQDPFSPPFDLAVRLAAGCYLVLGLFFLSKSLPPGTGVGVGSGVTALFLLGLLATNLAHYGIHEGSFSHIYSFFLFSLLVFLAGRAPSTAVHLGLGLTLALICLVRPPNLLYAGLFLALPPWPRAMESLRPGRFAAAAVVFAAVVGLQPLYWWLATGSPVIEPYPGERFNFLSPQVLPFLFSAQKGLFFWHPVLFVLFAAALYGLWRGGHARLGAKAVAIFAVFVFISASWGCWWYGYSFGQRVAVEMYPFAFALFFLAWPDIKIPVPALLGLFALLAAHNLVLQYAYWFNVIPGDSATADDVLRAYGRFPDFLKLQLHYLRTMW